MWWGAGTAATAEWAAAQGVDMKSSTLLSEATGACSGELQRDQINRYRAAWKAAGHDWTPRVSVSRSIFPITTNLDDIYFGRRSGGEGDQIGIIDGARSTFGKTYAGARDDLIEVLKAGPAVEAADTVLLTSQANWVWTTAPTSWSHSPATSLRPWAGSPILLDR